MKTSPKPAPIGQTSVPSPLYANYVLALLLTAYILSFIDRQVLSLLVGPIRAAFDISDFQFSLLHGMAFAIFYTVMGLPIGRLVDRYNRRNIISLGVFFWSLMTCACGMAQNFIQLFLARIGVGVGEASLSPAAYSMLSDYFSEQRLGRALAVYSMGITLGGGLAFMVGGHVYDYFAANSSFHWPLLGTLAAWQSTFIAVGLPGLLVTCLLLGIREPVRRDQGQAVVPVTVDAIPIRDVFRHLSQHRRAYLGIMLGVALMGIVGYGTLAWFPELLQRRYGLERSISGSYFGLVFVVAGTLCTFCGAWFTELLKRRGHQDAELRLVMLLALGCLLPAMLAPLMPTATLALAMMVPALFLHYAHFGVAIAALQLITPNAMRGQVSAVMLFVSNIVGLAFGGSIIAFFTDFIFMEDQALYLSVSVVCVLVYPLVALVCRRGLAEYGRLRQQATLVRGG